MKKSSRINVITLGCSKNLVDSEELMGILKAADIEVLHNSNEPSDITIVNTCGFINDAKEESIDTILENVEAKRLGHTKKVYVMGCLSQRYKKDLEAEIEMVDGFYGVNELPKIIADLGIDYKKELVGERKISTPSHYAYMKISEGCDRTCSFCAIPLIRGKHVSKPAWQIVDNAKRLVDSGVKELILIAQDLTYYGVDLTKKRELPTLLDKLAAVEGLEWIRLQYTYPTDFPLELLDVMASHKNICKYIDMPLQHASDPILKSMRRFINRARTEQLLQTIRKKLPEAAIRTTLITGFPGEKEEHFQELKDFVREQQFDRLGVFTYSHEDQTRAHQLEDDVPEIVKQRRMEEIMDIQQQISYDKNQAKVGKMFKVLIDRKEGEYMVGRTEFDSPEVDNEVLILPVHDLKPGDFYETQITRADFFDLYGE